MRPDMSKIIVERPRWGHQARYPRGRRENTFARELKSAETAPMRESMSMRRYNDKHLSENLAPLYRFLRGSVGRPWNKVWSELCEHVSPSNAVQKHILGHVFDL